jgi:hypothetical protein
VSTEGPEAQVVVVNQVLTTMACGRPFSQEAEGVFEVIG